MKFYAEILHPESGKVLWHYFVEAADKKTATEGIRRRIIEEHSNGFLLDTGGSFILIVEEDKDPISVFENPLTNPIYGEHLFRDDNPSQSKE